MLPLATYFDTEFCEQAEWRADIAGKRAMGRGERRAVRDQTTPESFQKQPFKAFVAFQSLDTKRRCPIIRWLKLNSPTTGISRTNQFM